MYPTLRSSEALALQAALVLIGTGVLTFMLWEPHIEGRNANATTFEIYFKDPFLAYAYLGSTPFFVELYRAFGLLGHARRIGAFSQVTVDALRAIKRCAIAIIGFVAGGVVFIVMFGDREDRPQGIVMSSLIILSSIAVASVAARFARNLQDTLGQSEDSRG
jgi:hypothetical protein